MKPPTQLPHDRLGFVGISHAAIRQWRLLLLGALALVLVASMAWQRIARLQEPLIEPPIVQLLIPYPGASAEDIEALVIRPVEEELFAMEGVDFIESKALPNYAQIFMRFEYGTPMDPVTENVRGKVLGKRKELPDCARDVASGCTASHPLDLDVLLEDGAQHRADTGRGPV
jgi:multidrug efflux pump subunit AcrB